MAEPFDYAHGDVTCRGRLALPSGDARAPGIAVFSDIRGIAGQQAADRADRLATELGYLALAADIYGGGESYAADPMAGLPVLRRWLADPHALAARAGAALDALAAHPRCDGRLGAIGFCFGGTVVLELARRNHPGYRAGASFHGGLATVAPADRPIAAKLLVLHGAEDVHVPYDHLVAFLAEMAAVDADAQTIAYTGQLHGFTNENAPTDGSRPDLRHDAATDRRSWAAMTAHFREAFQSGP